MAGPKNKQRSNSPYYLPTASEIHERKEIGRWMLEMDWPDDIMDAVMYHDSPTMITVRRLVYLHGPIKALKVIRRMHVPIEDRD